MDHDWIALPEQRRAIHRPTGLILEFRAATDGSGAMSVDTPNPEALPEAWHDQAETVIQTAWAIYAAASEEALKQEWESDHSGTT
ncbi:MAG: hypothetical protein G8237_07700 [Magnetococcales bacterium]|nr:hypothetical protein [Magnetococcales bacterium]NGZ06225.1 hypothetical protein [Magnetococcales bacterium]